MPIFAGTPAVTASDFRLDWPEFSNTVVYQDSAINYWLAVATLLLNPSRWPGQPSIAAFGNFVFSGNPAPGDTISFNGTVVTFVSAAPTGNQILISGTLLLTLQNLITFLNKSSDAQILKFTGALGGNPTNPTVLLLTAATSGSAGNLLSISDTSAFITESGATLTGGSDGSGGMLTLGTELFVAHNLVLEQQAFKASKRTGGGWPGISKGAITAESAGQVSVNYEAVATLEEGGGNWSLTVYGSRFFRLCKMAGAGPVQVGPCANGGPGYAGTGTWGWSGPNCAPGWFGS